MLFSPDNFQNFLEASPVPVWIYEVSTLRFVWVNAAAIARYGYSEQEFREMSVLDIRPPVDRAEVAAVAGSADRVAANASRLWCHRARDGSRIDVRVTSMDLVPPGCGLRMALVEDVTSFIEMQRVLQFLATHDPVTGLLNLQALCEQLDADAAGGEVACIRFPGLVEIADLYGMSTARAVVVRLVAELQRVSRGGLWACQWPDTLVVGHEDPAALQAFLHAAHGLLEAPVVAEGAQWQLSLRAGIAGLGRDAPRAEQVLACAALAARAPGVEGLHLVRYDDGLGARAHRRRHLAVQLRQAIRDGEIEAYLQPIVRADGQPGDRLKFEALARWRLEGVAVSPCEFIPIVEGAGLSTALLRLIAGRACEAVAALRERGRDCVVTVNVPAIASVVRQLPDELLAVCRAHAVEPACLAIEITESAVLDDPATWRKSLALLRYMGMQVAIDDFGTGFNSLAYLDRLPADAIKLDRSFTAALLSSDRQALICAAMIRLAHGLGLRVVAEGVEDERQREWLLRHGCDELQGYLIGRPMPLADVLDRLDRSG